MSSSPNGVTRSQTRLNTHTHTIRINVGVPLVINNCIRIYFSNTQMTCFDKAFKSIPDSSVGKESACNAGDPGLIPGREDPLEKG